jgi:hypothetical protein
MRRIYEDAISMTWKVAYAAFVMVLKWNETMKAPLSTLLLRRDLLRGAIAGVAVTATGAVVVEPAAAKSGLGMDKRKARYRAGSAEVQEFYRVNAYPGKK